MRRRRVFAVAIVVLLVSVRVTGPGEKAVGPRADDDAACPDELACALIEALRQPGVQRLERISELMGEPFRVGTSYDGDLMATFDGRVYDFAVAGEFVALGAFEPWVELQVRYEQAPPEHSEGSVLTAAATLLGEHLYSIHADGTVYVNGFDVTPPGEGMVAPGDGSALVRVTAPGTRDRYRYAVVWPGPGVRPVVTLTEDREGTGFFTSMTVFVPRSLWGQVWGLFGDANGDPDGDPLTAEGFDPGPVPRDDDAFRHAVAEATEVLDDFWFYYGPGEDSSTFRYRR